MTHSVNTRKKLERLALGCPGLTPTERVALGVLMTYMDLDPDKGWSVRTSTFAWFMYGRQDATAIKNASNTLRSLRTKGVIEADERYRLDGSQGSNGYYVRWHAIIELWMDAVNTLDIDWDDVPDIDVKITSLDLEGYTTEPLAEPIPERTLGIDVNLTDPPSVNLNPDDVNLKGAFSASKSPVSKSPLQGEVDSLNPKSPGASPQTPKTPGASPQTPEPTSLDQRRAEKGKAEQEEEARLWFEREEEAEAREVFEQYRGLVLAQAEIRAGRTLEDLSDAESDAYFALSRSKPIEAWRWQEKWRKYGLDTSEIHKADEALG